MSRTLDDFVRSEYPNHVLSGDGSHALVASTAVGEFTTADPAAGTLTQLRRQFGDERVSLVTAAPPSGADKVVRPGSQDTDSMADVPKRRPLIGGLAVGIAVLLIVAIGVLIAGGHVAIVIICAVFAATLGAIEGAIVFGGARFAGEKAWVQESVPAARIQFVAVFAGSEHDALEACKAMSAAGATSVRVVNESGAWHLPNLFTTSE